MDKGALKKKKQKKQKKDTVNNNYSRPARGFDCDFSYTVRKLIALLYKKLKYLNESK